MRIIGLLAVTFLIMLVIGRVAGRDALLVISVTANLVLFGLAARRWLAAKIARAQREASGRSGLFDGPDTFPPR